MLGPLTILKRPKSAAEIIAEIRTHVAAVDALLNGLSLDCNMAAAHIEDAQGYLTDVLGNVESAGRYEQEYQDAADNERERIHPWMASERYP